MRALVCHAVTGTLDVQVEDVADPVAGPGQVVVRVAAASVDFVDTLIATGRYQVPVPVPFTPGNSVAGEVVEVGPGAVRFAVGDRVHGMGGRGVTSGGGGRRVAGGAGGRRGCRRRGAAQG
ncbi:alcohol dehydrogenase catalytic domain-containing protein [Blastococcus sp. SYSU D01042]